MEGRFTTTVQPAASAGATLRVTIAAGRFQGVISRLTPTGRELVMMRRSPLGDRLSDPGARTASSLYQRKNSAA